MADTQQLPSWMTLSTIIVTNTAGQPIATSLTTLELPLTYYGPSIPLGTDGAWVWGGLTPPSSSTSSVPSTSTFTSSTATPSTTTTPSTITSPSTLIPASTFSTTTASTTSSASPSPSTLSTGAIIGIIFGAIVAFNLLLLLVICIIRRSRNQRNRNQTPIWTHWEVVGSSAAPRDEERPAGVGSPRDSGEEADSFLRRSRSAMNGSGHADSSVRPVPSLPPGAAPPQIIGSTGSGDSGRTTSSVVTDYGVLLPGGGPIGQAYRDESHFPARSSSEMVGFIMPPGELLKIDDDDDDDEPMSPPRMYSVQRSSHPSLPEVFSPLLPPPPLDIDRQSARRPSSEKEKSVRSLSYPASDMEDPKVYTARRVKVKELGPRSPSDEGASSKVYADDSPVAGPSSWRDSFGLGSLSRLRKSWFGGSSSRNTSKSSNGRVRADDAEAHQSLLDAPRTRSRARLGLTIEGDRPMSSISTKSAISGNTIYHDAMSRLGTPVSVPSRAMTPASARGPNSGNGNIPPVPSGAPPAYAVSDPYDSVGSRGSFPYSQGVDVLDLPVPQPTPFAASGGTSAAIRNVAAPPGLSGSHTRAWRDSLSVITGSSNDASVTTDVLDAEPPAAGEVWRSMTGLLGARAGETGPDPPGEQRVTFGTPQVVHQPQPILSDRGSLHSVHSHLSPYSRSSGSVPLSPHALSGSNSSRPSGHASSGSARSFSSFGRRQGGPISPSVSAFGSTESGRLSPLEELPLPTSEGQNRISVLGPMPSFAHSVIAPTIQSGMTTTSDDTEVTRITSTTNTDATLNQDGREEDLSGFRLGAFDFERVRI